jgi:predicted nucleic acid-binding Zn ribbon protein
MARPTVTEVKTQIDTHEAICAERWQETINRIKRLEMIIIGSGGAIILLLINIIVFGD